jgi:hypothetical protein
MIMRALDSSGDWVFGRGKNSYKTDIDAIMQSISTRLNQWKGDCFFATQDGVDWNNYLDRGRKTLLDVDIKRVILQTGGVLRISSFESTLDRDTRAVSVSASVDTTIGTIDFSEVI